MTYTVSIVIKEERLVIGGNMDAGAKLIEVDAIVQGKLDVAALLDVVSRSLRGETSPILATRDQIG